MTTFYKLYAYFGWIKKIGLVISAITVVFMMFFITYDVIVRNIFSSSIRGGFEIIQNYMMPLIVFPGLAYVYGTGMLPKMELLLDKMSGRMRKGVVLTLIFIEIVVLIFVVYFSWVYAMAGLERQTAFPAAGTLYPLYPLFFIIPIAFFLMIIENLFILVKNVKEKTATFVVDYQPSEEEQIINQAVK
ncbi:TRAP-type C4-dicarboxylate transport system permease small subunit [Chryseomicrobium aureum]|uniref:TRAP transporter small permease n=1 Tax=Chryseomicrobium aureum TaxID=1441723 RepID=UPI00195D6818|nr:TRAP transporter small permease [Chryseomicrobium aureum]MBM7707169.1 TRAP-type C4-dicarboxylate transport system permease small subunit [Chryseomicrobium aureum]